MDAADASYEAVERDLRRRRARLACYLQVRAWVGAGLVLIGTAGFGVAAAFGAAGLGLLDVPELTAWTTGFGAVLAPMMPAMFGVICVRAGAAWWRQRHPEDPDTGCRVS